MIADSCVESLSLEVLLEEESTTEENLPPLLLKLYLFST